MTTLIRGASPARVEAEVQHEVGDPSADGTDIHALLAEIQDRTDLTLDSPLDRMMNHVDAAISSRATPADVSGWDGRDPHRLFSWGGGARPDGVYTRGGDAASISWLDASGRIQVDGDGAGAAVAGLGGLAGPDQGLITVVGVARHQNPGANTPYLFVDEDPEGPASNNFARVDFKNTQFTTRVAGGAATHTDISGLVDETLWHVWVIEIDYAAGETRLIIDDVPGAAADVTHAETPNGILYTFSRVGDGGGTGRLEVANLTYRRWLA